MWLNSVFDWVPPILQCATHNNLSHPLLGILGNGLMMWEEKKGKGRKAEGG